MPDGKPDILGIWGDDIGISTSSCYSRGVMGYHTPKFPPRHEPASFTVEKLHEFLAHD